MRCPDEFTEPADYLEVTYDLPGVIGDEDYLVLCVFIPVSKRLMKMVEPVFFCVLKVVTHVRLFYLISLERDGTFKCLFV